MSEEIKNYLSQIGTKGGSVKTPAKAKASAENGAKGGRPSIADIQHELATFGLDVNIQHAQAWSGSASYCHRHDKNPAKWWACAHWNEIVSAWVEPTTAHETLKDLRDAMISKI